jgi:hypothetical protein
MIKTLEICYLGSLTKSKGKAYRFKVTRIQEGVSVNTDPKTFTNLFLSFKKVPIPQELRIGDYLTVTTEDDAVFNNFKICTSPKNPLPIDEILTASAEEITKKEERKALLASRLAREDVDYHIKQIKRSMMFFSSSEKAAFALYVYQRLFK